MTFDTFKLIYLFLGVLSSIGVFWKFRKNRDDLVVLSFMSVMMFVFMFATYRSSLNPDTSDDISEYLFRALTHTKPDLVLAFCNSLVWGIVPFGIAIQLGKKRRGQLKVWFLFAGLTVLKTVFDDYFIVHRYSEELRAHSGFEWYYVLTAWLIVYSLSALFITKGVNYMKA